MSAFVIGPQWFRFVPLETNVVIHSAAAVRFDEPLRIAMEMNVIAVKEVIKLVRDIKVNYSYILITFSDPYRVVQEFFRLKTPKNWTVRPVQLLNKGNEK